MQEEQTSQSDERQLLTARQVQEVLHIDRSTVYRMAEDGRIPALRVGKQWRFPRDAIVSLVDGTTLRTPATTASPHSVDPAAAAAAVDVAAHLLGVSMVVTDMEGRPLTGIANPCPWLTAHQDDPDVMDTCIGEWRELADDHEFTPRFRVGQLGFECARAFIRSGRELVGMVLAGGVCPQGADDPQLVELDASEREAVLTALPAIASTLSRFASAPVDAPTRESA